MRDHDISQRRACRLVGVDPKTVRRERPPDNPEIPEVEPVLLAAVGRASNNLNQISRALNIDRKAGRALDLIAVRVLLIALDRQLADIIAEHSR